MRCHPERSEGSRSGAGLRRKGGAPRHLILRSAQDDKGEAQADRLVALHILAFLIALLVALQPIAALAHDPSAWGGIYRSRDEGGTWLLANEGRYVAAAIDLAINPTDPNELLLATDSGLLRSRNGGRDWRVENDGISGGVFSVAFAPDGRWALASTATGLYRLEGDTTWRAIPVPSVPPRPGPIVPAGTGDRVYLAGWRNLLRSDDWGSSWTTIGAELPDEAVRVLLVARQPRETIFALAGGQVWASVDAGGSWQRRDNGLPSGRVDTLTGGAGSDRLWAGGADQLFRTVDSGASWQVASSPLPDADTAIRGIGVSPDGRSIIVTSDRGLYRGVDGGARWELLLDGVPIHLEARPLVRDPGDPSTLYAGFSIMPYESLWQTAAEGGSLLRRLDPLNLAGGLAFLLLLALGAGLGIARLGRYYAAPGRRRTRRAARGRARRPMSAVGLARGTAILRLPASRRVGLLLALLLIALLAAAVWRFGPWSSSGVTEYPVTWVAGGIPTTVAAAPDARSG